jgi:hypothetical protein
MFLRTYTILEFKNYPPPLQKLANLSLKSSLTVQSLQNFKTQICR